MIKLSELLKQRSNMSAEEFKNKVAKFYIKEIVLDYIGDLADEKNIKECEVSFNYNSLRKNLSLDDVIDIISGKASEKITECVEYLIDFDEIKEYTEEELEAIELDY